VEDKVLVPVLVMPIPLPPPPAWEGVVEGLLAPRERGVGGDTVGVIVMRRDVVVEGEAPVESVGLGVPVGEEDRV